MTNTVLGSDLLLWDQLPGHDPPNLESSFVSPGFDPIETGGESRCSQSASTLSSAGRCNGAVMAVEFRARQNSHTPVT